MKQILIILSAISIVTVYSSCDTKEYRCRCINTRAADTVVTPIFKTSQQQAKRQCQNNGNGYSTSTFDCDLWNGLD